MRVMKILLKLMILPILPVLILIFWIGVFVTGFSSVIFNLLSGVFFGVAVLSYLMGIAAGAEAMEMLAVGFAIFIVPHIAEWFLARIALIRYGLGNFLKS